MTETENLAALAIGAAYHVPMNLIDGRPWVPTLLELPNVYDFDRYREQR
jgi:hypothetical protein